MQPMTKITPLLLLILLTFSCSDMNKNSDNSIKISELQARIDSLSTLKTESPNTKSGQIATFLTFQNEDAEQAMNFYLELFDHSKSINIKRWGKEGPGKEGTLMHATFILNGKLFMCSDSPAIHDWGFTPAVSNFVECKDENELEFLFTKLSENGKVMMPLDNYGFSKKFGFVEDQFGVSWQLNLQ
ncbi:VOC family protein [Bizionia paragorgiae]|jgi:predicted 3-demethylubiquinone-9 3-methyltransferase (glyoxalase superfamily)|uniref:VOC family protein n=1 Tax=Bizionia paragorgiae TaxID=283786 RepID=UPI003A9178CF